MFDVRISKVNDDFCGFFLFVKKFPFIKNMTVVLHMLRLNESAGQVSELQQDLELVQDIHSSSETILVLGGDLPD